MTCYHPVSGWRSASGRDPESKKWPVVFSRREANELFPVVLPCGKCIGCRTDRARSWAIRCVHEAQLYDDNQFLTLTYDKENLDKYCGIVDTETGCITGYSLNKRDFQLFLKRLRKWGSQNGQDNIRYYHAGEYGESFSRPHHHACVFNLRIPDRRLWQTRSGVNLYTSATIDRLWGRGYATVGDVTADSAAYVARYVDKKINGPRSQEWYGDKQPEYTTMSRRPGIAHEWWSKFSSDVLAHDAVVLRGGLKLRPPKYYDKLYEQHHPDDMERIRKSRLSSIDLDNRTPERLAVLEKVRRIQYNRLQRVYENERTTSDEALYLRNT